MIWDPSEYAFSTWTLDRKPLKEALALIKENGFDDLEIWANAVHLDPGLNPDIHQVRQWIRCRPFAVTDP